LIITQERDHMPTELAEHAEDVDEEVLWLKMRRMIGSRLTVECSHMSREPFRGPRVYYLRV
jgi:hypothetical protein